MVITITGSFPKFIFVNYVKVYFIPLELLHVCCFTIKTYDVRTDGHEDKKVNTSPRVNVIMPYSVGGDVISGLKIYCEKTMKKC